jgi:hypothetical protein
MAALAVQQKCNFMREIAKKEWGPTGPTRNLLSKTIILQSIVGTKLPKF